MRREYVVVIYSIIMCLLLYWISPRETVVEYSPARVQLSAILEPVSQEDYDWIADSFPNIKHRQVRQFVIELNAYGVEGKRGAVTIMDTELLMHWLEMYGLDCEIIDTHDDGEVYRSDDFISSRLKVIVNLNDVSEEQLVQCIGSFNVLYNLTGLDGEIIEGNVCLKDILELKDSSWLMTPLVSIDAKLSPASQVSVNSARQAFNDERITDKDVMKIDIALWGRNMGDLVQRDIFFLAEDTRPKEQERIYWYSNYRRENDGKTDKCFYSQEGLVLVKGLTEQEIRDLFSEYVISYRLVDEDGKVREKASSLGALLNIKGGGLANEF